MGDKRLDTMLLSVTLNGLGHHAAAWQAVPADENELDLSFYKKLAERAEQAGFDLLLIDDLPGFHDYDKEALARIPSARIEAVSLVSALIPFTKRIGLAAAVAVANNEPYHVARKLASIDHLTNGRAAWSIAADYPEAIKRHFGIPIDIHDEEKTEQTKEFIDVVLKLWDSWEDDALIIDKASGYYADPAKYHPLHHKGKHYVVKGALNTKRPPQGYPVLIHDAHSAVLSPFEAKEANILFTSQSELGEAQRFYGELHAKRPVHTAKVLLNITPYLGRTNSEAKAKKAKLDEAAFGYTGTLGGLSVRDAVPIFGSAAEIADQLEQWFAHRGCDGFNLVPAVSSQDLQAFAEEVVPELRRRGLFLSGQADQTLRERLGVPVPDNQFAVSRTFA
ncbi:hypothetical protein BK133_29385 [Paenibacillus sp. FSL H8-0548]|uniref:LLM class flavin-dependent oxidoreductase n=1 Tax=Paenibacillus sp. FSL H8-0548 TaxID=1920422 RepID=UPI00096FABC2|nr:LLM class flavin-dependent oxidoreductase [Paenibacillus sp. FSL H8-0548]OMF20292.1 hypothetical protein BK133_29385 [Paenibacillus sp. FSL H8-0548]